MAVSAGAADIDVSIAADFRGAVDMCKLTLIGPSTCPYVQRVLIALREKRARFDAVDIDLAAKPDWLLAISPLGKVPVLRVEREGEPPAVIFESAGILDYLDEALPGERLHPADPLARARHRGWIAFGAEVLTDLQHYATATDGVALAAAHDALLKKFRRLEASLAEGPYFAGLHFSMVDVSFGPVFRQVDALETIAPAGFLDGLPRMERWRRALMERESVRTSAPADYAERYLRRLRQLDAELLKAA
jgi:glutathione S-transferase